MMELMNLKLKAKSRKPIAVFGFTLIELLVVIAIIGLLSSIAFASLSTARNKAKDAAIKEDLIGIRTSAALYFSENNGNYGGRYATAGGNENNCPPLTMMQADCITDPNLGLGLFCQSASIFSAIQHATNLHGGGWGEGRCGANSASYAVLMPLAVQQSPNPPLDYFCVDSTGQAKILSSSLTPPTDLIIGNADTSSFSCL